MAGHIQLGDDGDVAAAGILDDVGVIVLAEVAAGGAAHFQAAAVKGQVGPRLDLDAPTLVVAQVEVEVVDLVKGQPVDVAGHVPDGEEVAGYVQHDAAPGEAGGVA